MLHAMIDTKKKRAYALRKPSLLIKYCYIEVMNDYRPVFNRGCNQVSDMCDYLVFFVNI